VFHELHAVTEEVAELCQMKEEIIAGGHSDKWQVVDVLITMVGILQLLDVPSTMWSHVSMDFFKGFLHVNSKSMILTVVDRFSKYAHFVPIGHPYTATSMAKAFFDSIVRLHGIPESIVSDRDLVFMSKLWTELFTMPGTKLQQSSAFHP
jgi:hypothetical protein